MHSFSKSINFGDFVMLIITTIIDISVGNTINIVPNKVRVDFKSSYENPRTNSMIPTINNTQDEETKLNDYNTIKFFCFKWITFFYSALFASNFLTNSIRLKYCLSNRVF